MARPDERPSAVVDRSISDSGDGYAGFWLRVWAAIIDSLLLMIVVFPVLSWLVPSASTSTQATNINALLASGADIDPHMMAGAIWPGFGHILLYWVLPAIGVVLFWIAREATPGKMAIGARIVDARTQRHPTKRQLVVRYLGYYVASLPFGLGLLWVGIDARKQGWHDKLAHTIVIRPTRTAATDIRADSSGWKDE